jgi:hypothetical protein
MHFRPSILGLCVVVAAWLESTGVQRNEILLSRFADTVSSIAFPILRSCYQDRNNSEGTLMQSEFEACLVKVCQMISDSHLGHLSAYGGDANQIQCSLVVFLKYLNW